jgi:hypothetical protein
MDFRPPLVCLKETVMALPLIWESAGSGPLMAGTFLP